MSLCSLPPCPCTAQQQDRVQTKQSLPTPTSSLSTRAQRGHQNCPQTKLPTSTYIALHTGARRLQQDQDLSTHCLVEFRECLYLHGIPYFGASYKVQARGPSGMLSTTSLQSLLEINHVPTQILYPTHHIVSNCGYCLFLPDKRSTPPHKYMQVVTWPQGQPHWTPQADISHASADDSGESSDSESGSLSSALSIPFSNTSGYATGSIVATLVQHLWLCHWRR